MLLDSLDRRAGAAARAVVRRLPGGGRIARAASGSLAPSFRAVVALLLLRPATRRVGIEALCAGAAAAAAARGLRDRLGRPRPGARPDGGLPSRHASAAVAIAAAVGRRRPGLGRALAAGAALGLAGRVASAEHDPLDVAAGAALGLVAARAVAGMACWNRPAGVE